MTLNGNGDRVQVTTKFINGTGTVLYVTPNEPYLPIAVQMDEPNEDGHTDFRFEYTEVKIIGG